ncbi:hypothetical protein G6F66_014856 [Rhizopus arrhizus]|nr:hypothetical protein G6F66_014856 [Rhizopus arrhizus]
MRFAATQFALMALVAQQRGPAARTWIAEAGSVGVDFDGVQYNSRSGRPRAAAPNRPGGGCRRRARAGRGNAYRRIPAHAGRAAGGAAAAYAPPAHAGASACGTG